MVAAEFGGTPPWIAGIRGGPVQTWGLMQRWVTGSVTRPEEPTWS